ncbi:helix-turn-helix domain-containing protein [Anaerocolumna sp.]|uniref:helix-turn-helix domain-containing protein n=1 Tax=Anaerocolumna sp. TaxID=2041569 RepID=UPI0028B18B38|nr:AraC family transcriptional regulator [Anaerocolumna sp.]
MGEEALYNHLEICTFVYNGNTLAAINSIKEKADLLKKGTSLQIKKAYLYSLNISIYNYILLNEKVSLHICCHKNEQFIDKFIYSHDLLDIGEKIIFAYGHCSEYLIEKHKNKHVKNAIAYIHSHLAEPLTLDKVCDSININPSYLSDIFRKQVKCTFSQYILKQRISLAKKLLMDSQFTVNLIAEKCGFTNQSYFCTCFRKEVGMTPCCYRNKTNL